MKTSKSLIVINLKKLNGNAVIDLIEVLNRLSDQLRNDFEIILALQAMDALNVSHLCKYKIFIQDIFSEADHCFLNCFLQEKQLHHNIKGVILNHPEKKLSTPHLEASVAKANQLNIEMLICASSVKEAIQMNEYRPSYIGIENEMLIGKDDSFTNHCPEIVKEAKCFIDSKILIGAGIKSSQDLKHVINTGGSGVLISSIILKSSDPLTTLINFLN